jgi:hypothetical protein
MGFTSTPGLAHVEEFQNIRTLELNAAERSLLQLVFILLGRMGRDPGFRLGAERGLLRGVIEIHRD